MSRIPSLRNVSTKLQRIADLARKAPEMAFTSLAHHIDVEWLHVAYRQTRKDGAVGVDGQTAEMFAADLEGNLQRLLDGFKSGTYRAPPVRRVHIPKGDGRSRPIGIPTFEDKVLQRAVARALEAIYEQDFLDCSYGFRRGRSAHQALEKLSGRLMKMGGAWVLEVDIQGYFDSIDHGHLRTFLAGRVRDGVIRRAIDKWLKAGVLEGGELVRPADGTPQGGVISPMLANIYLHEVLDRWFERDVRPRLKGAAFLIRYADDFVIAFEQEADARRVWNVLPKRFGKYGLTLHPEKTRLIDFRRPSQDGQRETIDLLGFTHYWGRSRKGTRVVKRKTSSSRFSRALRTLAEWCRRNRHVIIAAQHTALTLMLRGHYSYFGVTGNWTALVRFAYAASRVWQKWLNRRSQRTTMPWDRFSLLLKRYPLPRPRIVHSAISP